MADGPQAHTARKIEPSGDVSLDKVSLDRAAVRKEHHVVDKEHHGPALDSANFKYNLRAKEPATDKAAPQTAIAQSTSAHIELNLPKRPQVKAAQPAGEPVIQASSPSLPYAPTILDRFVTFIDNLLKKLVRFFLKKLEQEPQTVVLKIPQPEEEEEYQPGETVTQSQDLIMPAAPPQRRKKKEKNVQNW